MIELHGLYWPDSVADTRTPQDARAHTGSYVSKAAKHLPTMLKHCRGYDTAIQAGGHCGAWPIWLAEHFKRVFTWEPDKDNYECLLVNMPGNVAARQALLGDDPKASYRFKHNNWNTGGHHATPKPGNMPVDRIDDLDLAPDAIVLDVEGMELPALRGAAQSIKRYQPVIMIEHRGHGDRYGWGDPLPWLIKHGYRVADIVGHDKILIPRNVK